MIDHKRKNIFFEKKFVLSKIIHFSEIHFFLLEDMSLKRLSAIAFYIHKKFSIEKSSQRNYFSGVERVEISN